jgi:hypothetical protein
MKIEPGPSLTLDLPDPNKEGVEELNHTLYHIHCLSCGFVYSVPEIAKLTEGLVDSGYILEGK